MKLESIPDTFVLLSSPSSANSSRFLALIERTPGVRSATKTRASSSCSCNVTAHAQCLHKSNAKRDDRANARVANVNKRTCSNRAIMDGVVAYIAAELMSDADSDSDDDEIDMLFLQMMHRRDIPKIVGFVEDTQQTHHVETTLCECGILVTLFSTWYQRGSHVIACLVYDFYNNMAK